jgi:hypothetical protein
MSFRRWVSGVVVAGALLCAPWLSASAQQTDPVIAAFQADPAVIVRTQELLDQGFGEGPASRTLVAMRCGVAGCSKRILVAQQFSTMQINEQVTSIFAVVDLDFRGMVQGVTLVELATPFEL